MARAAGGGPTGTGHLPPVNPPANRRRRQQAQQQQIIRSAQKQPVQTRVHGAAPPRVQRRMQRAAVSSSAGQAARQAQVIRSARSAPVQRRVTGAPTPHQQRKLERAAPSGVQGRVNWHLAQHRLNRDRQLVGPGAALGRHVGPTIANVLLGAAGQGLGGTKGATQYAAGITPTRQWTAGEKRTYAQTGRLPGGTIAAGNTPGTDFPLRVLGGIAVAGKNDPIGTLEKTAKGLGQVVAGSVSALPQMGVDTVREAVKHPELGPGAAVAKTAAKFLGAAGKDYSRRYGGVAAGTESGQQEFQKRIQKEGAAPELIDIASVVVPGGAIAGRAAGALARGGALGERAAQFASAARPGLRVSAGAGKEAVVEQDVARNLFRVAGQRLEDRRRIRRLAKRGMKPGETLASNTAAREGYAIRGGLTPQVAARHALDSHGEVVMASKLLRNKAQRVGVSDIAAHNFHAQRLRQHAVEGKVRKAMADLTPLQRQALAGPVGQRIVDPRTLERALATIETRRADITAERMLRGNSSQVAPLMRGHADELALLDKLKKSAPEVFGGEAGRKLTRVWKIARDEQVRVEAADPGLHLLAADVRRYRPSGDHLGVPYEVDEAHALMERTIAQRIAEETHGMSDHEAMLHAKAITDHEEAGYLRDLPVIQKRYIRRVRDAQAIDEAHGGVHPGLEAGHDALPEPLYIRHEPRPTAGRLERTHGGSRANAAPMQSRMRLHSAGLANTHPDVLVNSLLSGIKRRFNWDTVGQAFERNALRPPPEVIERALGVRRNLDQLTPEQLRKVLDHMGLNAEDYRLWNPGRFYESSRHAAALDMAEEHGDVLDPRLGDLGDAHVHTAAQDAAMEVPGHTPRIGDPTRRTQGWYVVPKAAHEEIMASTKPSMIGGRVLGKAMGGTSAVLLGLSPGWEAFQVAANSFVQALSGRNPLDIVTANRAFRKLPEQQREFIDAQLGAGMGRGHARMDHLGAAGDPTNVVRRTWTSLRLRPEVQHLARLGRGDWKGKLPLNPIEAMFTIDDFNNSTFRRGALYSAAKRRLMAKTAQDAGRMVNVFDHVFSRPSREEVIRSLDDPAVVRELKSAANDMFGDYTRYTAFERRYLKRGIIFYGFFRYAIKALLYTLPKRHPVALAIMAKVAQLHNEQVNEMLGMTPGDPEAPWAYSRLFFGDKSIDLARMSPVETPITQAGSEGTPASLAGFAPPYAQLLTDQIYGGPAFRAGSPGSGYKTGGNAEENRNPSAEDRLRILANSVFSFAAPYRITSAATQSGKQGDDTLLWDPRPIKYKGQIGQAAAAQRAKTEPGAGEKILQGLLPTFFPKPDTTRTQTIPAVRRKRKQPQRAAGGGGGAGSVDWGGAAAVGKGSVNWGAAK